MISSALVACGGGGSGSEDSPQKTTGSNQSPVAAAGSDQSVAENTLVTLNGSGTDSDGSISSYVWTQTAGATVNLTSASSASTSFTTPFTTADETLTFQLTITDNDGATAVSNTNIQLENAAPITISGVVYNDVIEGATIVLKDQTDTQIGQVTSDELGQYSLTFENDQTGDTCYTLSTAGGLITGVEFTEVLTATYCGEFVTLDGINITPITTLIDVAAQSLESTSTSSANSEAKQQLINLGMITEDNTWNDLSAEIINYGMLSLEVKSAESITAWINDVIADMSDMQLSASRVSNIFKQAHGGIEKIKTADVSLFSGQSRNISVISILSDDTLDSPSAYALSDAPDWISLDGSSLTIAPSSEVSSGIYNYQISATPANGSQNRINTFELEVLPSVVLLEGTLDSSGGSIRNQFQDIVLTAPAGVLSQSYAFTYRASIDEKGSLITNLMTTPEMPSNEMAQLSLARPSTEILIQNYLQELIVPAQVQGLQVYKQNSVSSVRTTNSTPNYDSSRCSESIGDSWQDRNRDGFSFDFVWSCNDANFLDNTSDLFVTEFTSNYVGGIPFTYSNFSSISNYNIREQRAFVLRSNVARSSFEENDIPVLFIHGFVNTGKLGGVDHDEFLLDNTSDLSGEYFGAFPRLINEYTAEDGSKFSPFLFQWRTNVPFEVAAHHLGEAIEKIAQETGKKVHIIAHSFGGILSRTLIQGLAQNNPVGLNTTYGNAFVEKNIASLTTVGTPHSGIFGSPAQDSTSMQFTFNGEQLTFPTGVSSLAGILTRDCEAITCYQMGVNTEDLIDLRSDMCGGDCSGLASGKDVWFGMHEKQGTIVHQLRNKLETDGWPNIKTQVLIGLIGNPLISGLNFNVTLEDVKGDGLISLAGQRFDAAGESESNEYKELLTIANYQRFLGSSKIDEHFLGFQEFDEKFTLDPFLFRSFTNYYLADLKGDGIFDSSNEIDVESPDSDLMTQQRRIKGYNHRTGEFDKNYLHESMASEVGLQECTTLSPENCRHNTWQYFTSFMSQLDLGSTVEAPEQIALTGRIGNLEEITGMVTVIVKINGSESIRFELEGGANISFQYDIPFTPNAKYDIIFSPSFNSGFRAKPVTLMTLSTLNSSSLAIGQTILFDSEYQGGTIGLEVVDAISGSNISDYQVEITNIFGEIFYSDLDALTDGIQLAPGDYTFNISSGDYITKSKQCSALGSASTLCRMELVRPVSEEDAGKMTAILSWKVDPRDLDTHLVKYDLSGNQQYHIYYSHKNDSASGDNLDRDDTSSYGPETLTIQNVDADSVYVYYVYHYGGSGSISTTSLAQVDVTNFFSATEPFQAAYQAPTSGEGRYWKVFEVRNGVVEPCRTNCIMGSTPTLSSRTATKPMTENALTKKGVQSVPNEIYQSISFN